MDNKRTITVKGVGKAKIKVDYIIISIDIRNQNKEYEKTMEIASNKLNSITNSIIETGIEKEEIKTSKYEVKPIYESIRDKNGDYRDEFIGYQCTHILKLSFDFNMNTLNKILLAISKSEATPKINISFTVKDQSKISDEILELACMDAKRKADILCRASGYSLGSLLKIEYNWGEVYLESATRYDDLSPFSLRQKRWFYEEEDNIEPEYIDVSDNAVFIWEIN